MPVVARLLSGTRIVIKGREHLPPHVHAEEGDDDVLIVIDTGEIYSGGISTAALAEARAWVAANVVALLAEFFVCNPHLPKGAS